MAAGIEHETESWPRLFKALEEFAASHPGDSTDEDFNLERAIAAEEELLAAWATYRQQRFGNAPAVVR
jgi:hypothetical protein